MTVRMEDGRTWLLRVREGRVSILPLVRRVETDRFPELGFLAVLGDNADPRPLPIVYVGEWETTIEVFLTYGKPMAALVYPTLETLRLDGWEVD